MRRSRTILLSAVAAVVLATSSVAEVAAADKFAAKILSTSCTHSGDTYGNGHLNATTKATENGRHGVNYLVIKGRYQLRTGGSWHTVYGTTRSSSTFPNDASSHSFTQEWVNPFQDGEVGKAYRWQFAFEYWDQRPGPDVKLATKTLSTASCTA